MNHFHSVNVNRLSFKPIEFFTCQDKLHEDGQTKNCTARAKEILTEMSPKLTQFWTDEERAEALRKGF